MADAADVGLVLAGALASMATGVVTSIVTHALDKRKELRARRRVALEERLKESRDALWEYENFFEDETVAAYGPEWHEIEALIWSLRKPFGELFAKTAVDALLVLPDHADAPAALARKQKSKEAMQTAIAELEAELGIPPVKELPLVATG